MPGTVLGTREGAVIKTDKYLVLHFTCILKEVGGRKEIKKAIIYNIRRLLTATEKNKAEKGDGECWQRSCHLKLDDQGRPQ